MSIVVIIHSKSLKLMEFYGYNFLTLKVLVEGGLTASLLHTHTQLH